MKQSEWIEWREQVQSSVHLSKETLTIIHLIREALQTQHEDLQVYVSDRRWQRAAMLMKTAAFFNDRTETNHSDALLLQHCLWTTSENRDAVAAIVAKAVRDTGFDGDVNLAELDRQKEDLDQEVQRELYYSEDLYDSVAVNGVNYFKVSAEFVIQRGYVNPVAREFYIPVEKLKSTEEFRPVDAKGNEQINIYCRFDGQGVCVATYRVGLQSDWGTVTFTPKVLFHKGAKKDNVNKRLVNNLALSVIQLKKQLVEIRDRAQERANVYRRTFASPFVSRERTTLAYEGVLDQIARLETRIKDCDRIGALLLNHEQN